LGESGIDWEIKYWLEDYAKYNDTDALIRQRVWYVFQREHLEFAYPTRTIHIESKPQETAFVETVNTIFERLSAIPIFAPLSDEETQKLAEACVPKSLRARRSYRPQRSGRKFDVRHQSRRGQSTNNGQRLSENHQ
jgi:hypothetical protein